jgi:hypothetical protein
MRPISKRGGKIRSPRSSAGVVEINSTLNLEEIFGIVLAPWTSSSAFTTR